jgi:hypothetical protein
LDAGCLPERIRPARLERGQIAKDIPCIAPGSIVESTVVGINSPRGAYGWPNSATPRSPSGNAMIGDREPIAAGTRTHGELALTTEGSPNATRHRSAAPPCSSEKRIRVAVV